MSPECLRNVGRKEGQTKTRQGIRAQIEETKAWRIRRMLPSPRRPSIAGPEPLVINPNTWVPTTQLVEDTARLCSHLPGDIDAVLGIARSGLLPATQVAVMLEWNLFNTSHMDPAVGGGLVSDLDGILCADIAGEDDDDGPRYRAAIHHALAIQRPNRRPVPVIVTARLEKYRAATQSWLRRVGIRWQRLVMGPWKTLAERNRGWPENVVKLKSDVYLESGFNLFVESDPLLARRIHQRTEKPVLCPKLGRALTQEGE